MDARRQRTADGTSYGRYRTVIDDAYPDRRFRYARRRPLYRFCARLADTARRTPVRIAVLGDSFIEGDILTADLREQLQLRYGGRGCGFAPMSSPLTGYRRTVGTRSAGWNSYNIMQRRTTPEALRGDYSVSGWLCRPADGATVRWTGSDFRRRLDRCGVARLLFISREPSRLELTLNDSLHRTFDIPASEALRQIVVRAPVASLALRVVRGGAGFTGYGVQFEDAAGVTVDNYSIRSNNGQALFGTNPSVNAQIDAFAEYDLVILQYGLNIMQEGGHQLLGLRRPRGEDDRLRAQLFPRGGGAGALDQRPFGEVRHGIRPDVVGAGDGRLATPRSPCHRRRFLVGLRRHAGAGAAWNVSSPTAGRARTIPISTTPAAVR